MKQILFFPWMRIINANAKSSHCTIGVPGIPSWCGFMHALERQLKERDISISLEKIAVITKEIKMHTYQGDKRYPSSIINAAVPPKRNGDASPFIPEARSNLTISIIIEYDTDEELSPETINNIVLGRLKFAGGDIIKSIIPELLCIDDEKEERKLLNKLMPGSCLVERRDLLINSMAENQDVMDALIDHLKITYQAEQINDDVYWYGTRKERGWIVPIVVGYYGLTPLSPAKYQRDPLVPHRFAESIITLGEYILSYRIPSLDHILWHYNVDTKKQLYVCTQIINKGVVNG